MENRLETLEMIIMIWLLIEITFLIFTTDYNKSILEVYGVVSCILITIPVGSLCFLLNKDLLKNKKEFVSQRGNEND